MSKNENENENEKTIARKLSVRKEYVRKLSLAELNTIPDEELDRTTPLCISKAGTCIR